MQFITTEDKTSCNHGETKKKTEEQGKVVVNGTMHELKILQ